MASGTLFVVATPIGNLEDITLRALRVLREVDLIAAEDTRRTAKLLAHFDIRTPTRSLHEHNEWKESDRLVKELETGRNIALVTDAGTPAVSDPGSILVGKCREAGITVSPVPGPSAVMAALSVSGQPAGQFVFAGYVPRGGSERLDWFERLSQEHRPIVFFETPHRIARTLDDAGQYWPNRRIMLNRELTKTHEEFVVWPNEAVKADTLERGELVVVVESLQNPALQAVPSHSAAQAADLFGCLTAKCGISHDQALGLAAKAYGVSQPAVAKSLKKRRIAERQSGRPLP